VEGVADAEVVGHLLHHVVGRRAQRVLDHAQHPLGLVVVGGQLGLPVGDVAPLGVLVERLERLVERVGVDERATADTCAGEDQRVADGIDALDAVAADLGTVEELLQLEGGLRVVVVLEPGTGLEHADLVALLGEPECADRAAEARADDEDVVVEPGGRACRGRHARPIFRIRRRLAVITLA
jgi:hypothetical protein